MSEPLVVVEENHGLAAHFGATKPVSASSPKQLHAAMNRFVNGAVWVARAAPMVKWRPSAIDPLSKTPHRLLLIGSPKAPERAFLRAVFESVVVQDDVQVLEIRRSDVLGAARRANLFIGGAAAPAAKSIVLIRGDLTSMVVPFSWFTTRPNGPRPDFSDFEIIDSGQTIRLGKYEAATEAVLYEFDVEFRRRERKRPSLRGQILRRRTPTVAPPSRPEPRGLSRSDGENPRANRTRGSEGAARRDPPHHRRETRRQARGDRDLLTCRLDWSRPRMNLRMAWLASTGRCLFHTNSGRRGGDHCSFGWTPIPGDRCLLGSGRP